MYSIPAFLQASISVALIGRDASLMSGLAAAKLLESAARAGDADGDLHTRVGLLEVLGHGLGDRKHGARPINLDDGWSSRGLRLGAGVTAASTRRKEKQKQWEACLAEANARRRTPRTAFWSRLHAIQHEFRACFLGVKSVLQGLRLRQSLR
jgi:F0F1-type ATP synthase membrane subunit c/vacuolar-type H+-ATPase subunit K